MSTAIPTKAGTFLPIAGICCLAITGFLIATTIVLALIPLYVPQQHATVYTVPDDADRFQLGFRSTGAEGDDEVAGSVDNLSELKSALGIDDDVDVEDAFVQSTTTSDSGERRRRRRNLLQRNKRALVAVVVEVLINIKCKYRIARSCMGTCRDKKKTRVDSFIRGAGPLSIPSLKVKCGGVTHSLSPKSFSFNGITKQPAPLDGFGAVDSLDFTPIASGDIDDPKIWKNGIRPFRGCKVNVPDGIKLGISRNPYPIALGALTVAKGASLELGTAGGAAFVFARVIETLAISGTFSCLSTGGRITLPQGSLINILAGASVIGIQPIFEIYNYIAGISVSTMNIPLGVLIAAIIANINGTFVDHSQTTTTVATGTGTTTVELGATGIID